MKDQAAKISSSGFLRCWRCFSRKHSFRGFGDVSDPKTPTEAKPVLFIDVPTGSGAADPVARDTDLSLYSDMGIRWQHDDNYPPYINNHRGRQARPRRDTDIALAYLFPLGSVYIIFYCLINPLPVYLLPILEKYQLFRIALLIFYE